MPGQVELGRRQKIAVFSKSNVDGGDVSDGDDVSAVGCGVGCYNGAILVLPCRKNKSKGQAFFVANRIDRSSD